VPCVRSILLKATLSLSYVRRVLQLDLSDLAIPTKPLCKASRKTVFPQRSAHDAIPSLSFSAIPLSPIGNCEGETSLLFPLSIPPGPPMDSPLSSCFSGLFICSSFPCRRAASGTLLPPPFLRGLTGEELQLLLLVRLLISPLPLLPPVPTPLSHKL